MGKRRLNKTPPHEMPVMKEKCATCPFRDGGWEHLRGDVLRRQFELEVSQTCHSTGVVNGKPDTHLCRGARDVLLTYFAAMKLLDAPTDEAWAAKWQELQAKRLAEGTSPPPRRKTRRPKL